MSNSDDWILLSAAIKEFIDEVVERIPLKSGSHQSFGDLSPSGAVLSWLGSGRLKWRTKNGTEVPYDPWEMPGAQRNVMTGTISINRHVGGTVQHCAVSIEVPGADFVNLIDEYLASATLLAVTETKESAADEPERGPPLSDFRDTRHEENAEKRRALEMERAAAYDQMIARGEIIEAAQATGVLTRARERRDALRLAQGTKQGSEPLSAGAEASVGDDRRDIEIDKQQAPADSSQPLDAKRADIEAFKPRNDKTGQKIDKVLGAARTRFGVPFKGTKLHKTPGEMAEILLKDKIYDLGLEFGAIKKILEGSYPPMRSRGITSPYAGNIT